MHVSLLRRLPDCFLPIQDLSRQFWGYTQQGRLLHASWRTWPYLSLAEREDGGDCGAGDQTKSKVATMESHDVYLPPPETLERHFQRKLQQSGATCAAGSPDIVEGWAHD